MKFAAISVALVVAVTGAHGAVHSAKPASPPSSISAKQTFKIECVPSNSLPPKGYIPIASIIHGKAFNSLCFCQTAKPHMKLEQLEQLVLNGTTTVLSVGGTYKLLKITHDTTLDGVTKELKRLELPDRVVEKTALKIYKFTKSTIMRKASVGALVAAIIITAGNGIANAEETHTNFTKPESGSSGDLMGDANAEETQKEQCKKSIEMIFSGSGKEFEEVQRDGNVR